MGKSYETWKREAQEQQLNWLNKYCDRIWIPFELPSQYVLLFKTIADAIWPQPGNLNEEQYKQASYVVKKLTYKGKCDGKVRIGIAFIYAFHNEDNQYMVPVFRVKDVTGNQLSDVCKNTYVDHLGFTYDNWKEYLNFNTWCECHLIFPKNGCYFQWAIVERLFEYNPEYHLKGGFNREICEPDSLVSEVVETPILGIPSLAPEVTDICRVGLSLLAGNTSATLQELPNSEKFKTWKKNALEQQSIWKQNMGNRIWDNFEIPSEKDMLFQVIEDAFSCCLREESRDMAKKEEEIYDIVEKLICKGLCASNKLVRIGVAYIYVFCNDNSQYIVPLFRVLDLKEKEKKTNNISTIGGNTVVDHLGRIFKNWKLYLNDDTWDGCYLIYPEHGCYATEIVEMDCSLKGKFKQGIDNIKILMNKVSFGCKVIVKPMHYFPRLKRAEVVVNYFGLVFEGLSTIIGVGSNVWELKDFDTNCQKPNEVLDILTSLSGNIVHLFAQLNSESTDLSINSSTIEFTKKLIGFLVQSASLYFSGRNITDVIADWYKLSYLARFFIIIAVNLLSLTTVDDTAKKIVLDFLSKLGALDIPTVLITLNSKINLL